MNTSNKALLYRLIMGSLNVDCGWLILKSVSNNQSNFLFSFILLLKIFLLSMSQVPPPRPRAYQKIKFSKRIKQSA